MGLDSTLISGLDLNESMMGNGLNRTLHSQSILEANRSQVFGRQAASGGNHLGLDHGHSFFCFGGSNANLSHLISSPEIEPYIPRRSFFEEEEEKGCARLLYQDFEEVSSANIKSLKWHH